MPKEKLDLELEDLIKKAEKQPGIKELMIVYGQYENMIRLSHDYLMGVRPKEIISTSNNSSF